MKNIYFINTPLGKIGIVENGEAITELLFPNEKIPQDAAEYASVLLKEAGSQLSDYFSGKRKDFSLPLNPAGTAFMRQVWAALQTIPYGETRSYRDIAQAVGNPKASRAVGMANNRNPIPILIPCHRVIGADGSLVGYGGGLEIKEYLLELEKKFIKL